MGLRSGMGTKLLPLGLHLTVSGLSFLVMFCLAALGIQIVCLSILAGTFVFWREKREDVLAPVSVVVCARNEEFNLKILLPLLIDQSHPEYEIIVVSDRSTDGSIDFLRRLAGKHSSVRYIDIEQVPDGVNGKKYALTRGIGMARHDVVLLTDADCRPGRKWVSEMASAFDAEARIVLGYSPYVRTSGLLNTFIRFETLLTGIQYIGLARLGLPYMGVGRNLAYRKSFFQESKGFNGFMEVTGGDDDLWVNRNARGANTRIRSGADALVWSIPKTTWRAFLDQKLRHLSVGLRYRPLHRMILGLFNASYLLSWILPIACLVFLVSPPLVWPWFVVRVILLMVLVVVASWRLGDKFNPWPVILLDFLYVFYYISTALRALFIRKLAWTN